MEHTLFMMVDGRHLWLVNTFLSGRLNVPAYGMFVIKCLLEFNLRKNLFQGCFLYMCVFHQWVLSSAVCSKLNCHLNLSMKTHKLRMILLVSKLTIQQKILENVYNYQTEIYQKELILLRLKSKQYINENPLPN